MTYLHHRYTNPMIRIQREVRIPDGAVGALRVVEGQSVDIRNKIAQAIVPTKYHVLEAARELGLRDPDNLPKMLFVEPKDFKKRVEKGTPLAGKDKLRGRRVFAPADGIIVFVGEGRIIFQELPQMLELEAGVRGTVVSVVAGRSAVIETTGAWLQGVWGNGRDVIATMRLEPSRGVETISSESLDTTYKNEVVVTTRPLTPNALNIAQARRFAGVVAPSAPIELLPALLEAEFAVFLTEGFGQFPMNQAAQDLLKEFDSYQVTLDAHNIGRWDTKRPELIINRTTTDELSAPDPFLTARKGQRLRITREPYVGAIARVVDVPRAPVALENGLRVPCARVELLSNGRQVFVPIANLEFLG
jgi:hypothetical protein